MHVRDEADLKKTLLSHDTIGGGEAMVPLFRNEEGVQIINPHLDGRLAAEVAWYAKVLERLLPPDGPNTEDIAGRVIIEALMSVGYVVRDDRGERSTLKLSGTYQRHGAVVVLLCSVLEVVAAGLRLGLSSDECLDRGLEMENWRPIEPLPLEVRPLVRKAQRAFPVPLVRKMPLELFWFLALPRLVQQGLVEVHPQ